MSSKLKAAFLDFATLGPGVDTSGLDRLLDVSYYPYTTGEQIDARVTDCEVVIVNKAQVSGRTIAAADRLKLIVLTATGTDNVDTAAARARGVAVANSRDYCSTSVVQHVFALVLGLTQQIDGYHSLVRSGAWQSSRSFALFDFPIRELTDRVLGIVGYGSLGKSVADLGRCLGMRILVSARPGTAAGAAPEDRAPFEAVIEEADVLSLHCPLNETTHHLIGARQLERMKSDALLINTARGGLIDSVALVHALRTGQIGGAGIDVLPVEPPDNDQPLLAADIPNLLVTPHIAWAAREARQRALNQVAENVEYFMANRSLRRVV